MTENDNDIDNSAVAILFNVLMKLEQLTPQTFKVQDILDSKPKALQGNNCYIKSNVHPKVEKGSPNMPRTWCDLTNLCL